MWTKEDAEFTFPEKDKEFINLSSMYVKSGEDTYGGHFEVSIETEKGLNFYSYEYIDEALEATCDQIVELMDDWGWFNG